MADLFDRPVHLKAYLTGRCTKCKHYNEVMTHDYGNLPYRELEDQMDRTNHSIHPIMCKKCGAGYPPQHLVYRDVGRKEDVVRVQIDYSSPVDPETSAAMTEGHDRRYDIFKEYEREFWAAYTGFALEDWRAAVGELLRSEIEAGCSALGITPGEWRTEQQARKDMSTRFKTDADRSAFWQAANHEFITDEILNIGAMGWPPELLVKRYGSRRTRFAIMYFPIAEALETLRTRYIGQLFRKEKGDNAFLLRRIGQLTEDMQKQAVRANQLIRKVDEQKHEIAGLQDKVGVANAKIASLSNQQPAEERNKDDIRRIRELKSFVGELLAELRAIRPDEPEDIGESPMLDESGTDGADTPTTDLSILEGKTVAIIGGYRSRRDNGDYPCEITTHDGRKHDPDFYTALQQADIIVVLTRFISHASMWEARTVAAQEDKPIYYAQEINIRSILNTVVQK
ncbi:DUF2325 domain-containing protein [Paenibacillus sp. NRS-1780]|uniref:DUF2325 domain-containing protein n=1 Tax=Paenibacillus sp. NRS-1780 TaxID=3233904 RepID=UPI003D2800EB